MFEFKFFLINENNTNESIRKKKKNGFRSTTIKSNTIKDKMYQTSCIDQTKKRKNCS